MCIYPFLSVRHMKNRQLHKNNILDVIRKVGATDRPQIITPSSTGLSESISVKRHSRGWYCFIRRESRPRVNKIKGSPTALLRTLDRCFHRRRSPSVTCSHVLTLAVTRCLEYPSERGTCFSRLSPIFVTVDSVVVQQL